MKTLLACFVVTLCVTSCRQSQKKIVSSAFVDSLITNYSSSVKEKAILGNLDFWEKRMDRLPDNFVNGPEYASSLSSRFRFAGDIHDLLKADSLMNRSNKANQEREPGIWRALASLAIQQHKFLLADSFLQKSVQIEGHSLANIFLDFDVSFELGKINRSKRLLPILKQANPYGYLFRRSKYEHYTGSLDKAIDYMLQAAEKADNNNFLKQVALSNAADLYIHKGNLQKAYSLYLQSIKIDVSDFHSILGLGWIALVHDNNDSMAQKIFSFVGQHSQSPEVLLKMEQAAELSNDTTSQKDYAGKFETITTDSIYGGMYSKYLIDLYTGILNTPSKAVKLAKQEINSRPTPQAFSWYAWSLYCNNEKDSAYRIYRANVSGKPLEGLELYYIGKMLRGLGKKFDARQYLEAAYKNKFDLSPNKEKYLEENLE